jgi:hypothetical protein
MLLRKVEKVSSAAEVISRRLASAGVLTRCAILSFVLLHWSFGVQNAERKTNNSIMDHPYNGVRLQRHNSLPCKHHRRHQHPQRDSPTFPTKMSLKVSSSSMPQLTSSKSQRRRQVLSPTNLLSLRVPLFMSSSKTNPYVGSFRHAPPTSIPNLATAAAAGASSSKSPYVGWFRHAPPSTGTGTTQNTKLYRYLAGRRGDTRCCPGSATCGSSCSSSKLSFQEHERHHSFLLSPPQQQLLQVLRSPEDECLTWVKILEVLEQQQSKKRSTCSASLKTMTAPEYFISGHLRGGGGHYDNPAEDDDGDYFSGSSATLKILAKLGSWFLFPLAYDAESCGYYNDHKLLTSSEGHPPPKKQKEEEKDDPLDQQFLWTGKGRSQRLNLPPSLSTAGILQEEDDEESDDEDDDSSSASSCSTTSTSSSMPLGHLVQPRHSSSLPPSPTLLSRPPPELEVSVSEIAQAYYAHQTTSSVLVEEPSSTTSFHPHHGSSAGLNTWGSNSSSGSGSRLDYVITQIDIARMARNASRHLDVESILHLPTITYQSPPRRLKSNSKTTATPLSASKRSTTSSQATTMAGTKTNTKEFWSWMMVASSPIPEEGMSDNDQEGDQDNDQAVTICSTQEEEDEYEQEEEQPQDHVCVICLEHFVAGDRLRVLPCNHSFHVGCIDRWLSGSHSHEECFTSGCPTCKKRPRTTTSLQQSSSRSPSLSGAAGSVVAASSAIPSFVPCGFITTTTTRTTQEDAEAPQGTNDDLNGSHPSWAFAQLGSAMARSAWSTSSSISYD